MLDATELSRMHLDWVHQETQFSQLGHDVVRIDSPFLDSFQDEIVMYAQRVKNSDDILLTDDGWTNDNLEAHGVYLSRSTARVKLLTDQLRAYGVSFTESELTIRGAYRDFGQLKNRLLQAIIFVNDMFMLAPKATANFFFDDVAEFFASNHIRTLKNASFIGTSGLTHKFEFSIPGDAAVPMKLIKILSTANNTFFAKSIFTDIVETQQQVIEPTKYYVFLNDRDRKNETKSVNADILRLFGQANATSIPYSKRADFVAELAE